jgi:hypothetical protein
VASIFIQIASYHDYELPRTIMDAIDKCSGDNTINFGIHLSYYVKDEIFIPNLKNIKFEKVKSPQGIGVGYGRYVANTFYDGEDYYLQIDSHMRFSQDWDKKFINNYKKYLSEGYNPVLSAYPAGYHYENHRVVLDQYPTVVYADFVRTHDSESSFAMTYFLHQTSMQNKPNNFFTRAISGGEIFSSGAISKIYPNTKMFNWGEEFLTAIRLFTHGYDLMLPETQPLYHLYYSDAISSQRRLAQLDYPEETSKISQESNLEIGRIINNKIIGDFELGSKRTLKDFGFYAKIDFDKKAFYPMV